MERQPLLNDGGLGSPERWAWLETLDHRSCTMGPDGRCWGIHCPHCGAAMGGGWGPCPNRCSREVAE